MLSVVVLDRPKEVKETIRCSYLHASYFRALYYEEIGITMTGSKQKHLNEKVCVQFQLSLRYNHIAYHFINTISIGKVRGTRETTTVIFFWFLYCWLCYESLSGTKSNSGWLVDGWFCLFVCSGIYKSPSGTKSTFGFPLSDKILKINLWRSWIILKLSKTKVLLVVIGKHSDGPAVSVSRRHRATFAGLAGTSGVYLLCC